MLQTAACGAECLLRESGGWYCFAIADHFAWQAFNVQLTHRLRLKVDPTDVLPPRGREDALSEATQQLLQLAEANKSGVWVIAVVLMAAKPACCCDFGETRGFPKSCVTYSPFLYLV